MRVIQPPGKGRRPLPIDYNLTRHLEESDIAAMWESGATVGQPTLKTLRHNHHLLAKAVASGKSLLECSRLCGLTPSRISVLKNDPAFLELVSFYEDELQEVYVDVHQRMAALGTSVLEELQERFEESPDKFTKRELMELFTTMADRSIPTAKGGPRQATQAIVPGPNGGLALQINFVSPQGEVVQELRPLAEGPLPGSLPGSLPSPRKGLSESELAELNALAPSAQFYPPGTDLDGEPAVPAPPPFPTQREVAETRYEVVGEELARREAQRASANVLRAEYMAKR